jgi:hypothetical protein
LCTVVFAHARGGVILDYIFVPQKLDNCALKLRSAIALPFLYIGHLFSAYRLFLVLLKFLKNLSFLIMLLGFDTFWREKIIKTVTI